MKFFKEIILLSVCAFSFIGTVEAKENSLSGKKLGFGFDRGLGITGTAGKLNGFLGNTGVAVDKILEKDRLEIEAKGVAFWFVNGGGYVNWNGSSGARLPVGAEWYFKKKLDVYAQVIPNFQISDKPKFGLDFGLGVRKKF